MLAEFIYQWNPFNIYGIEVGVEDLLCHPLQPSETLRQDSYGCCRRIKVPTPQSTLWERAVFWLQTHLNEKGHLEAIDKLISLFYQKIIQFPPQKTEKLQEVNSQINQLRSLKNDYEFVNLKSIDASFIDSRLKEIEQHAYSIFTYYYKLEAIEQEEEKKKAFILFQEQIELKFKDLASEHSSGLIKARFLMIVPAEILRSFFEERAQSINARLKAIQDLHQQINEMERLHEGKFTIPSINKHLHRIRTKLGNEVCKIRIEVEAVIRHLILNYHLAPFKEGVKMLLDSIQIDPEENRKGESCACMFQEALEEEIERIRHLFNEK